MPGNDLTAVDDWETAHSKPPRMRLPSSWNISIRDTKKLLSSYVRPGMRVLEIGCAPGKMLAFCAAELKAEVAGIDYSRPGMRHAAQLFEALGLKGKLRCENMFAHSFPHHSFDLVYSLGVIEHFQDPAPAVEIHTQLLKTGGVALIVIPNYAGFYGWLQKRFDPGNLLIHNVELMSLSALTNLVADDNRYKARSWAAGKLSPWLIGFHRKWPATVAHLLPALINFLGIIQPLEIDFLRPMLVLEITRLQD